MQASSLWIAECEETRGPSVRSSWLRDSLQTRRRNLLQPAEGFRYHGQAIPPNGATGAPLTGDSQCDALRADSFCPQNIRADPVIIVTTLPIHRLSFAAHEMMCGDIYGINASVTRRVNGGNHDVVIRAHVVLEYASVRRQRRKAHDGQQRLSTAAERVGTLRTRGNTVMGKFPLISL